MKQPTNKEILKFVKTNFTIIWEGKTRGQTRRIILLEEKYRLQWTWGGMPSVINKHFGTNYSVDETSDILMKWFYSFK